MINFKIRNFKLSDIDQGIYNIQKEYDILACLKLKLSRETGKKEKNQFLCIQDYVMQTKTEILHAIWKMLV